MTDGPHSALPLSTELLRRVSGSPLLLLLDIDGTISHIAPRPADAVVLSDMRRVLADLAATPNVHVVIVTGRAVADARRLVAVDNVWTIGNHGFEVAAPDAPPTIRAEVLPFKERIAEAATRAHEIARRHEGVIVENKRWTISVHFRLAARDAVASIVDSIRAIAHDAGLAATGGKELVELRPPVAIDKGIAALDVARTLGATSADASLLCAGDDRTDEDMFREVRAERRDWITVCVGEACTATAELSVADPDAMRALLEQILARRRGGVAGG